MEFTQEFAVIQGTLLTLQKKVGMLKTLTQDDSSVKENIPTVVNTLMKTLTSFENTDYAKDGIKLRQISLFLVLNSNLKVCELLKEDSNCGHIIDSAPTLSNDLMFAVFSIPMLSKYFHELVVHCPPVLGIELLDVAATNLKRELSGAASCIAAHIQSVYIKLLTLQNESSDHMCNIDCVALKFMSHYTKFLELFVDPSRIYGENVNKQYLEEFGQKLMTSLELVTSCLKFYINPVQLCENILNVYRMNLTFDYKLWHQPSENTTFNIMHDQLFSVLVVQISNITVDVWLGWAELNSKLTCTISLQKDIAESMYKCHEVIKSAKEKGVNSELLEGLLSMLSSMASKPRDEDDEIKEADITLILERISDQSFCQKKWLIALFTNFGHAVKENKCVECIKKNIDLIDSEIISLFLEKIFLSIENREKDAVSENVKSVFFSATSQLCLGEQVQLLKELLDKYGFTSHLCSCEYSSKITKVFNTAVDSTEVSLDKKYMEFIILSLQNPLDVMKRLLEHSVASDKQAQIMGDVLVMLKPFHSLQVDKNKQASCSLLVKMLYDIMQKRSDMLFSESSFISLVTLLATNHAIPVNDFLKYNLLPLIHKCLIDQNWPDIILWLETLQVFVDGTVKSDKFLDTPTVLLILAQIMELSRKSLCTFSGAALTACNCAINLINILLESFLADVEDATLVGLNENIMNLISPINQFYFFELWSKSGNYSHFIADWKVYLLHWMYMEKCNLQPPWECSADIQRKKIILELAQLLPICVKNEWRTIVENLHNLMYPTLGESSSIFVFECLIDAIQIMALLSSSPCLTDKERECTLSCLDFCVRNLSVIAKEEFVGKPDSITAKNASILFQKIVHLNYVLPIVVKESCAGILLNMQVDFISSTISDMQMYSNEEDEERDIVQGDEVLRSIAISITMVEDQKTRQALARKLQEGLGVVVS